MSDFHRHNPELVGTDADPWMIHPEYRKALHHHRSLSDTFGASDPETPAGDAVLLSQGPRPAPSSFDDDGHCEVCGAPVGKHHLAWCDLRGDA